MEDRLRKYMDDLFSGIEPTDRAVELKEEISQNLIDKYNDLIAEGKTPEAAYNSAIAGIGDTNELFAQLRTDKSPNSFQQLSSQKKSAALVSVAVALYIMCIIPPIIFSQLFHGVLGSILGPCLMFAMIGIATALIIYNNMTRPKVNISEEPQSASQKASYNNGALRMIKSSIWSIVIVVYILVSFYTHAWHITWVIFLIGAAVANIIKASFELRK